MAAMADDVDEVAGLRAEVERLRGLVGVDERAYEQLLGDVAAALAHARASERELGRVRAEFEQLNLALERARSDQDAAQLAAGRDIIAR